MSARFQRKVEKRNSGAECSGGGDGWIGGDYTTLDVCGPIPVTVVRAL
jgi:hypothetical protein